MFFEITSTRHVDYLAVAAFHAEKHSFLLVAVLATIGIAIAGALFSYAEKLLTTTVGQRVMHDLRSMLYSVCSGSRSPITIRLRPAI